MDFARLGVAVANRPRQYLTESKPKLGVKERRKDRTIQKTQKFFRSNFNVAHEVFYSTTTFYIKDIK